MRSFERIKSSGDPPFDNPEVISMLLPGWYLFLFCNAAVNLKHTNMCILFIYWEFVFFFSYVFNYIKNVRRLIINSFLMELPV